VSRNVFIKLYNTKFHENPFVDSRVLCTVCSSVRIVQLYRRDSTTLIGAALGCERVSKTERARTVFRMVRETKTVYLRDVMLKVVTVAWRGRAVTLSRLFRHTQFLPTGDRHTETCGRPRLLSQELDTTEWTDFCYVCRVFRLSFNMIP
jgi:hypothetical protein